MIVSRRFINFALTFCTIAFSLPLMSCKGRTAENMEPTGDTVEVVVVQTAEVENN